MLSNLSRSLHTVSRLCKNALDSNVIYPGLSYRIAGNYWGRKISQILWFCGYTQKFPPAKFGAWHPLAWQKWAIHESFLCEIIFFTNSRKFSPSKVSCYTVLSWRFFYQSFQLWPLFEDSDYVKVVSIWKNIVLKWESCTMFKLDNVHICSNYRHSSAFMRLWEWSNKWLSRETTISSCSVRCSKPHSLPSTYALPSFSQFVAHGQPFQKHMPRLLTVMQTCCLSVQRS